MDGGGGTGAVLITDIRIVEQTGSTNADLLALAREGAREGRWLRAETQRAGRGRQGRAWVSPPGNLYASTLVRLARGDPPAPTLALVAAVALEEAVSVFHPAGAMLKWPNDLLIDGAKLAGILIERADDAVIVGIGVNLAHHPDDTDRPATSLAANGTTVTPDTFLAALAETFACAVTTWRTHGIAPIRTRWLARAHPVGTPLSTHHPDGTALNGQFDGLDSSGALILRLADGTVHVMHAGDVFLL